MTEGIAVTVAFLWAILLLVWVTVLPTVGLLWMIGFLK